jgi:hypothetical protein
VKIGKIG